MPAVYSFHPPAFLRSFDVGLGLNVFRSVLFAFVLCVAAVASVGSIDAWHGISHSAEILYGQRSLAIALLLASAPRPQGALPGVRVVWLSQSISWKPILL